MRAQRTQWNPWAVTAFEACFRPWMRRRLGGIYLAGLPRFIPEEYAVVMAANHVSWWDAFVLRELQRRCVSDTPLLTLMREDRLRRFPYFRWMGVVGIDASPGSLRRALREVSTLTVHPPWLTVFPQGRLWPSWRRPLEFKRSAAAFARALAPALVVPVGIHYEVLHKPQPMAFSHAGVPVHVVEDELPDMTEIEQCVEEQLEQIYRFLSVHGEEAAEQWPSSPFSSLSDETREDVGIRGYEG